MLHRKAMVPKMVPVQVTALRWCGALKEGSVAAKFKCSACRKELGARRFGAAWDGSRGVSMRLCEDCGVDAEKSMETPHAKT